MNNSAMNTTVPLAADDPTRELAIARSDDEALLHLAVVGDTYTVLLSGEQTAGRFAMLDMLIPPGGGPPPHRHAFEESFRVLAGSIEVQLRDLPPLRLEVRGFSQHPGQRTPRLPQHRGRRGETAVHRRARRPRALLRRVRRPGSDTDLAGAGAQRGRAPKPAGARGGEGAGIPHRDARTGPAVVDSRLAYGPIEPASAIAWQEHSRAAQGALLPFHAREPYAVASYTSERTP